MIKNIGLHRFYAYPKNDLSFTPLFRTRECSTGRNIPKTPEMPGPQNTGHFPFSSGREPNRRFHKFFPVRPYPLTGVFLPEEKKAPRAFVPIPARTIWESRVSPEGICVAFIGSQEWGKEPVPLSYPDISGFTGSE
jgi:hypothetical protein